MKIVLSVLITLFVAQAAHADAEAFQSPRPNLVRHSYEGKNAFATKKIITAEKFNANGSKALSQKMSMGQDRGGGDPCEDRIKVIRDDIKSWILKNGADSLQLPRGLSSSQYEKAMLQQISFAQIHCVSSGDKGYPVMIDQTPKVCRFDKTTNYSVITCDFEKFQSINESNQYVLIHHEYAGLADVERPNGADSNYEVSNQISAFLENFVVKRLVVKPRPAAEKTTPAEMLVKLFEDSQSPASIKDFGNYDGKQHYNCAILNDNGEVQGDWAFQTYAYQSSQANETGPLFPPATVTALIYTGTFFDYPNMVPSYAKKIAVSENQKDRSLQVNMKFETGDCYGQMYQFRKNGNLVAYKRFCYGKPKFENQTYENNGLGDTENAKETYGYCWKE